MRESCRSTNFRSSWCRPLKVEVVTELHLLSSDDSDQHLMYWLHFSIAALWNKRVHPGIIIRYTWFWSINELVLKIHLEKKWMKHPCCRIVSPKDKDEWEKRREDLLWSLRDAGRVTRIVNSTSSRLGLAPRTQGTHWWRRRLISWSASSPSSSCRECHHHRRLSWVILKSASW